MSASAPPSRATLLPHIKDPDAFASAFGASQADMDRLATFAGLLAHWQRRINLVAPSTLDDVWHRHFADSAQLLDLAPPDVETWLDLGTGAGFPGLVIAILYAGRPGPRPRITLVESDQRKCAFLAEVVRRTRLALVMPVDIVCARIEATATRAKLQQADVVSARALAPLERLLELASPYLGRSGRGLFLKGRGAEAEIAVAARTFEFSHELVPSRTEAEASIIVMRGPAVKTEG